ncbi:hypothetical protein [Streptomyces sp. NPDC046712]|uniref:hypothetical protein n=1 Tax=Streptomyces sp. NPDC046712 TaxID=3154802 RepID=UPI0033D327E4
MPCTNRLHRRRMHGQRRNLLHTPRRSLLRTAPDPHHPLLAGYIGKAQRGQLPGPAPRIEDDPQPLPAAGERFAVVVGQLRLPTSVGCCTDMASKASREGV